MTSQQITNASWTYVQNAISNANFEKSWNQLHTTNPDLVVNRSCWQIVMVQLTFDLKKILVAPKIFLKSKFFLISNARNKHQKLLSKHKIANAYICLMFLIIFVYLFTP